MCQDVGVKRKGEPLRARACRIGATYRNTRLYEGELSSVGARNRFRGLIFKSGMAWRPS